MNEDWYIIASGPSAQGVEIPEGVKTACVNGSVDLIEGDPDAYLVGENKAAIEYKHRLEGLASEIFMRDHAARELNWKAPEGAYNHETIIYADKNPVTYIGFRFGPRELHYLHLDKPSRHGPATWISSGNLMLWVLCELMKANSVTCWGMDGYDIEAEYAKGIKPLENRPERTPEWCRDMNRHMGMGTCELSKFYTETGIIFPEKPRHYSPGWNVRIGL